MHHYRQALIRMRQGDSDRDIAKSGLMGRRTAAALRTLASTQGWLDTATPLPDDATVVAVLAAPKRACIYVTASGSKASGTGRSASICPSASCMRIPPEFLYWEIRGKPPAKSSVN